MLRFGNLVSSEFDTVSPVASSSFVLLSEAVEIYLKQKGKGRPINFRRAAERACGYVIDACGDKHLDVYTKADANAFRDALISRGLAGNSLTRVFGTVRAVINFAASEQGLSLSNPFAGVYYDRNAGVSGRNSIPPRNCPPSSPKMPRDGWPVANSRVSPSKVGSVTVLSADGGAAGSAPNASRSARAAVFFSPLA
jgi:hypothetical protein